jgi:hypothetical protein
MAPLQSRGAIPISGSSGRTMLCQRSIKIAPFIRRGEYLNRMLTLLMDDEGTGGGENRRHRNAKPVSCLTTDVLAEIETGMKGRACPGLFAFGGLSA